MNSASQLVGFRVGALLGPMCFLLGFQVLMSEPSGAHASDQSVGFLSLPDIDGIESKTQDPKASYDSTVQIPSPFWFQEIELSLPEMPQIARAVDMIDERTDPTFVLSAVLPSTTNSFAVINGKPYTEGDEVVEGWELQKISGKSRYVVMLHESGRRIRVTIQRNR